MRRIRILSMLLTLAVLGRDQCFAQATASEVKITKAIFAKAFDENGQPQSPGSQFKPTDTITLRTSLNSRPASGQLSCRFSLGKQEITVVSVDLATLDDKSLPAEANAYGVFTLRPIEPFPVSADYRAQVLFEGESLGVFKFSVVEPEESEVEPEVSRGGTQPPTTNEAAQAKETKEIVQTLLRGTAYVEGVDASGNRWTGTAWLLDKERRLLVTNDHVATADAHDPHMDVVEQLQVYFPDYRGGRVIHEASHYEKNVRPIQASVVYGSYDQDLALLQAESLPDGLTAFKLADASVEIGDSLYSLGGIPAGSEGYWIYTSGEVRAVYQRRLANGRVAHTVEADMQTNQGNSGGPVVNNRAELVAVVEGHNKVARSVSLYIDLEEIRSFLETAEPLIAPTSVEQYTTRGEHHYEAGRLDQALADFTQVLKLDPNNAYAMSSRGWIFYDKQDYKTAVVEFNEAIAADKTMLYAYRGRAMVELDTGENDKAIEDLTHAIRNSADPEELAEFYNERGVAYSRMDDAATALEDFDRAIGADAEYAWAHGNRGNMLLQLERYEEAVDSLQTAIQLDDSEADFMWMMGKAAHMLDNHDGALKMFGYAIETDPKQPDYFVDQAKCLLALERYEDAGRSLAAAIELDSQNDRIHNEVGIVAFNIGNYPMAHSQFRAAAEIDSGNYLYWFNSGHSAYKMGELDSAIRDLNQSIRLDTDFDAFAIRGNAYSLLGRTAEANQDFAKARELAPENFRKYNTKYFRVANQTNEPLTVFVQYYTKGTDGVYHWYPRSGDSLRYDFAPGEEASLNDAGQLIHGARFHVWADGVTSGKTYADFKQQELIFVGEAGYLTSGDEPQTETYHFRE